MAALTKKVTRKPYPEIHPKTRAAWRTWLAKNHESCTGTWLIYYKVGSGKARLPYADAVEEALCFGWIDSVINPIDEHHYKQLFTPRKPNSEWSKVNKARLEKLIADKRMMPAGLATIKIAKENGSWSKIDHVEAHTIPPDFAKALAKNKTAKANFEALAPSVRKAHLHRIGSAKREETRAVRIERAILMLCSSEPRKRRLQG